MRMSSVSLMLPSQFRIDDVEAVYEWLDEQSADANVCTIDARQIERIDFCGLQLIVAFVAKLRRESIEISWNGVSEAFQQAVDDAQLHKYLGLHAS